VVPRRFLELFAASGTARDGLVSAVDTITNQPRLAPFRQGSGRLELAQALLTEAKPLTARVVVNRLWMHHFGKGLVRTPGDFGHQGDRPSHPELLEWLSRELAEHDAKWSLKHLHRLIVTSGTYRQASALTGAAGAVRSSLSIDPDNHLLSRMNRRRLEIEPWRDAMLSVAGNLDDRMEAAATELDQPTNRRRTLYGRVGRDEQNDMLRIYDFPPPTTHSPSRDITTTPLQQLFVFNSDFVEHQATTVAARLLEPTDATLTQRIERCYQMLFQRPPRPSELQLGERFLTTTTEGDSRDLDRWRWYIQSLFGLNEFLFVD
jgi:hypothetical protein